MTLFKPYLAALLLAYSLSAQTRQVVFVRATSQTLGCSPITVLQAGTMSYPMSFLASGQTSVITPSVTGLPATCTATFSPATVPAGGGATVLTMNCGYTAPLGNYVLTLGGETSTNVSTTVSQSLIVGRALYYISSVAPALASPAALTGSLDYVASPVYVNGSTGNWNTWRASGTLFSHTITVANIQPNFPSTPTPFTWTGSNNGTGSSAVSLGNYNFVASASSMVASMTTDTSIRTVTLYGGWTGGSSGVVTVTAHLSSGAAPDEVSVFTVPFGLSYNQALTAKWVFTLKDSAAGTLSLTMTSTTTPAVLQAITVN